MYTLSYLTYVIQVNEDPLLARAGLELLRGGNMRVMPEPSHAAVAA
jgi:hypothetical protein